MLGWNTFYRGSAIVISLAALGGAACSVQTTTTSTGGTSDGGTTHDGGDGGANQSDGATSQAPEITLATNACPAFAACAGDEKGTWEYSGGCVEDPFPAAKQACPAATVQNPSAKVKGRITFDGARVKRNATLSLSATVLVPSSCAVIAGGCSGVAQALKSGGATATCTGSSDCTCQLSLTSTTSSEDPYTRSGNTITVDGDTYDLCVTGDKLGYHGTSAGAEPGNYELTKK